MSVDFVHLSVHTQYSILDSVVRIPALMSTAAAAGMPAVALTDQSNLFAMVKFYRGAMLAGIKPIIGIDLLVSDPENRQDPARLLLLCRDRAGYRNLTRLVTLAYLQGQTDGRPVVDRAWMTPSSCGGLIALSGGIRGDVGRGLLAGKAERAHRALGFWRDRFDDRYFIELTRVGHSEEERYIDAAVSLAAANNVPVVATNDVRFLASEEFGSHDARVCINQGRTLADPERSGEYTAEQYLRTPAEMAELFADIPEALRNSVEIARRCSLDIELGESHLPKFPVPDGLPAHDHLRNEASAGLTRYLAKIQSNTNSHDDYRARLNAELEVICDMGFAGYFLIVADFIRWAKEEDIPVGPGRGSGAGSLVAWVLGITDIDPLAYDLLFERFLNPERVSMPDFDIDFCMDGRDRVIDYVAERYGRDRVSQIITYGTMAAKAVVRDAGRVLGQPYGFVDRIAKLIPFEIGMTLDKALETEKELRELHEGDEEVSAIIDLARSLEGLVRNAGKHAGGVVIAPTELTDFAPLYCEPDQANIVTQFDKDDVEAAGLVKFDFLGLRTLTVIDRAVKTINRSQTDSAAPPLDIRTLALDDEKTFAMLRTCRTTAIFQLESRGMKDLIKRLQPDKFEDLIALVALFRPGPLQSGMVDDFIERKHKPDADNIDFLHPDLKPVLESTYGVILYQEQVMQIAQVLAGYTLGGADLLRRAMGKKKPEEMAKQREIFTDGAKSRGVPAGQATRIFDLMEKFAGYGFNKSHSAAYALLSYQTAWLKTHHPAAFMAAVMSADIDNTDKLVVLKADCRDLGIELLPPCVNGSAYEFSVAAPNSIRYGLGAVKGVGRNVVDCITRERDEHGEYLSLAEFCQRLGTEKINRRALEALIKSGALDIISTNRRHLLAQLPEAIKRAEQSALAVAAGQNDMFGMPVDTVAPADAAATGVSDWNDQERLKAEKEALGLYLSGHPFAGVRRDAACFTTGKLGDLATTPPPSGADGTRNFAHKAPDVTVAGLVMDIRKRGNRVTLILDDDTAQMEATLFAEAWEANRHIVVKDAVLVVSGALRYDDFIGGWRVTVKSVQHIDKLIEERAQKIVLSIAPNGHGDQLLYRLHDVLTPYRDGGCGVLLQYTGADASARVSLGNGWAIKPTRDLRDQLEELLGNRAVRLVYASQAERL